MTLSWIKVIKLYIGCRLSLIVQCSIIPFIHIVFIQEFRRAKMLNFTESRRNLMKVSQTRTKSLWFNLQSNMSKPLTVGVDTSRYAVYLAIYHFSTFSLNFVLFCVQQNIHQNRLKASKVTNISILHFWSCIQYTSLY
jgi:hypothetical protein